MSIIAVNSGIDIGDLTGDEIARSYLGTPVQSNIIFEEFTYETRDGEEIEVKDEEIEGSEYLRIDTVLFEVMRPKQVKRTRVPGRDGTVKEYIGDGDFEVNMRGKLMNEIDQRPSDLMAKLERVAEAPVAVSVQSPFLSALGIEDLVILERRYEERRGRPSEVSFSVRAVSEAPVEAEINETIPPDQDQRSRASFL